MKGIYNCTVSTLLGRDGIDCAVHSYLGKWNILPTVLGCPMSKSRFTGSCAMGPVLQENDIDFHENSCLRQWM